MNKLIEFYRGIERVLSALMDETCDCGVRHSSRSVEPDDHRNDCPYRSAVNGAGAK